MWVGNCAHVCPSRKQTFSFRKLFSFVSCSFEQSLSATESLYYAAHSYRKSSVSSIRPAPYTCIQARMSNCAPSFSPLPLSPSSPPLIGRLHLQVCIAIFVQYYHPSLVCRLQRTRTHTNTHTAYGLSPVPFFKYKPIVRGQTIYFFLSGCVICSKQNKNRPASITFRYHAGQGVNMNSQGTKAYGALTSTYPSSASVTMNGELSLLEQPQFE